MLKQLTIATILFAGILTPRSVFAQANTETKPVPAVQQQHYRLDFVVKEVEAGKVVNSRSYSMVIATDGRSSIRTGTRIPFTTSAAANSAYNQIDVGVNIDCYGAKELNNQLMLNVKAEVSSLADSNEGRPPGAPPVIRNNSWESNVVLPIRQPTTIFSSDDLASKRKMQLELTATPIK